MSCTDSAATSSMSAPPPRPVIYVVGDSLTQRGTDPEMAGWVSLMADRYNRSADIVTRGLSGYNTKWFVEFALPVIEQELANESRSTTLITLWLGANDAALPGSHAAKQHVPLAAYKENLVKIVRAFQAKAPNAKILLITPPHVDDAVRQASSATNTAERTNAAAGEYARACVDVAGELELNVLDLHTLFNTLPETERAACLEDGLHFTAKGNRLVDEHLKRKIHDTFPEMIEKLEAWQLPNFHVWFD